MARITGRNATLCGLAAILLWSTASGLIRSVSQQFGAIGGAALVYSVGALLLLALLGKPRVRKATPFYLASGSALFVAYEICLSLALGYALDNTQAIQLVVVNYLWPSLTVLLAIFMNRQPARWYLVPGTLLALLGVAWVVSTEGVSLHSLLANMRSNPLGYSLALTCAVTFALYCNITRRYANGQNHVVLFFLLTAAVLWIKYAFSQEALPAPRLGASLELLGAGLSMAGGYALWNIGILRGNLTLLATASYFAPVLSAAFASAWLGASLGLQFWQGALLVTLGSLLCWQATRERAG